MGEARVPVTVVVPVRDGEDFLVECLDSVLENRPAEVIVVDGCSTDGTHELLDRYPTVRRLSDEGYGLPFARMLGVQHAHCPTVLLLDVDVVLPRGSLQRLYSEFERGRFDALQAGLIAGTLHDGYWGRALAEHQRTGRSRHWLGVCATLVRRSEFLECGLDLTFASGEDIELRHRLVRKGARIGVSTTTSVQHRFRDGFEAARAQWCADGEGLARTIRKNGLRDVPLVALPAAATARGVVVTVWNAPWLVPYWACFLVFNYAAMARALVRSVPVPGTEPGALSLPANSAAMAATRIGPMLIGAVTWLVAARGFAAAEVGLAAAAVAAAALVSHLTVAGAGPAMIIVLPQQADDGRRLARVGTALVAAVAAALALLLVQVARLFSETLREAVAGTVAGSLFVVLAAGFSAAYFLDHVAVGTQRGDRAMRRSLLQATCFLAVTLGGAVGSSARGIHVVLLGAALGAWLSVFLGVRQQRAVQPSSQPVGDALHELARLSGGNYALTMAQRAPMFLLPLVVTEAVSAEANAAWYAVWMMAMALWYVPNAVGLGLQTRLVRAGTAPSAQVGAGMRTAAGMTLPALVALLLVAPAVLSLVGPLYRDALPVLWVLAPVCLFALVTEPWIALHRVRREHLVPTLVLAVAGAAALGSALLLADRGLVAIALAWTLSQAAVGVVAALLLSRRLISTAVLPTAPAASHPEWIPSTGSRT